MDRVVLCRKLASCLLPCINMFYTFLHPPPPSTPPLPLSSDARLPDARGPAPCASCVRRSVFRHFQFLFIDVIFWVPLHLRHILAIYIHPHVHLSITYYYNCGLYPIMGWESGLQMNECGSSICSHVLSQEALKSVQHEIWTKQENFEQLGAGKVKFVQWRRYCWGRVYSQSYKTKWCPVPGHFLWSWIGLYSSQSFGRVETKISQCCITQHVLFWVGGEFGVSVKAGFLEEACVCQV